MLPNVLRIFDNVLGLRPARRRRHVADGWAYARIASHNGTDQDHCRSVKGVSMIVRPRPGFLHLFFIMRGSVVPR
ncbi:MAG: hypothetical protein E5V21_28250, partial [Mesorhizobium sp.]